MAKEKKDHAKARPIWVFLAVVAIAMLCMTGVLVFIVHASCATVVNELIGQTIYTAFILLLYEPMHKKLVLKAKLTVSYKIGFVLFFTSLCFLYAGFLVETKFWLWMDWGIALLFSVLGFVWYFKVYGNEAKIGDWADRKLWAKKQKMYREQGMTEDEIFADAKAFLECYTVGNSLESALDQNRYFSARNVTLAEMEHDAPDDPATVTALAWLKDAVHAFKEVK